MKLLRSKLTLPSFFFIFVFLVISYSVLHAEQQETDYLFQKLTPMLKDRMKEADIPGLAVIVFQNGKEVYSQTLGYANREAGIQVSDSTLFEMGSNTKALTALAILKLQQEGYLKLTDDIRKYLPELYFNVKSTDHVAIPVITIAHLLHHTSGIPFHTIDCIIPDTSYLAFEWLGHRLNDIFLDYMPGTRYQYATVNYDLLGWIIERVTQQYYENFMEQEILEPLGMPYACFTVRKNNLLASGYKPAWLKTAIYHAPVFRSNYPAGYLKMSLQDLSVWLQIQLGNCKNNDLTSLISSSHIPNRTVSPNSDGASYAAGWLAYQDSAGTIKHGGRNPNFSSYILVSPKKGAAIAVMANINSSYVANIVDTIENILNGDKVIDVDGDMYRQLDTTAVIITIISLLFILITLYFLMCLIVQVIKGKRTFIRGNLSNMITKLFLDLVFLMLLGYCLYIIPYTIYDQLSWAFVKVWAPVSFTPAILVLYGSIVIFYCYYFIVSLFQEEGKQSYYPLIVQSCFSGIGNTLIILTINAAVTREEPFFSGFAWYFIFGLFCYIYHQQKLRQSLVKLVHNKVFDMRIKMINLLLDSPYQKIEEAHKENIINVMVSDTEQVSNFPSVIVAMITSTITLICCFIYLGSINIQALVISVFTILIAATLYFYVSRAARDVWEQSRTLQNTYVRLINDLIQGFKELRLNNGRSKDFEKDIRYNSLSYKEKNIVGGIMYANVFIVGELIFSIVIGVVTFIFPLMLLNLNPDKIRTFVLVFIYMTGPVNMILNGFPQITRIRISLGRINKLQKDLAKIAITGYRESEMDKERPFRELILNKIRYSYHDKDTGFVVGPLSYTFQAGEIIFITGGNGSGKSTLAKMICGLYTPDQGSIILDGTKLRNTDLSQFFAAVFSDYHLFDKLYGISKTFQKENIDIYMQLLQLKDKTMITGGGFSTIQLSTGQKKRLALLVCYLEDKPIYLFDEWAADQDPIFRRFFYEKLLPDMKKKGKCVIVISHDDQYFHVADKMLVLESGKIKKAELEMVTTLAE